MFSFFFNEGALSIACTDDWKFVCDKKFKEIDSPEVLSMTSPERRVHIEVPDADERSLLSN